MGRVARLRPRDPEASYRIIGGDVKFFEARRVREHQAPCIGTGAAVLLTPRTAPS